MINVHILEPPKLSNVAYWRLWEPLRVIKAMYPGVFRFTFKRERLDFADAWNADLVITARPGMKPDINEYLQKAQANGAQVIVDTDDHILGLPRFHDLYHDYKPGAPAYKRAEKTLQLANQHWFSTPKFLETYSKAGLVVPNAVLPDYLPDTPAPDNGIWAWRGRSIQVHDLIYAGQKWYDEIKDKPKKWLFLGWLPPLSHEETAETLAYVDDTQKYIQLIRQTRLNGIWKPMVKCDFNDHKSNVSWLEAAISGGVCLTNYAGKPEWKNSTAKFPTHKEGIKLWEKSKAEILENYNLVKTAQARAQNMLHLCSHLLPTSADTAKT